MDLRVMILHKQHYLDDYQSELKCDYSCWGYYDGISLKKYEPSTRKKPYSRLFEKKTKAEISTLWYAMAEQAQEISGGSSQQIIGLYREDIEFAKKFDNEKDYLPFFGIAFLQLKDVNEFEEVQKMVENNDNYLILNNTEELGGKPILLSDVYSRKICYHSFDNDDLIVLIHTNKLDKLNEEIHKLENAPEVSYVNAIIGVQEKYLHWFDKQVSYKYEQGKPSAEELRSSTSRYSCNEFVTIDLFLSDIINRLRVKMSTSGDDDILYLEAGYFREQNERYFFKGYKDGTIAFMPGQDNLVFELKETDVYTLLSMLTPGGFCTHQNPGYKKTDKQGCVYSIETVFTTKFEQKTIEEVAIEGEKQGLKFDCLDPKKREGYCQLQLIKFIKRMKNQHLQNLYKDELIDEAMYAYYQALIQTLNTLNQFERFEIADDVFYLVYPSLRMFLIQVDYALKQIESYDPNTDLDEIVGIKEMLKVAFGEYLSAVNNLLYHAIHTDQVFLMIPGYSGAPYSVPIKLNMLYLWMIRELFEVLKFEREFGCIVETTMENRPSTKIIEFTSTKKTKDYLVHVKVSQRTLYIPRILMIIICHEMGHYIGGRLRDRKKRCDSIISAAVNFLAWSVFPYNITYGIKSSLFYDPAIKQAANNEEAIHECFTDYLRKRIEKTMGDNLDTEGTYYGSEVEDALCVNLRYLLSELVNVQDNQDVLDMLCVLAENNVSDSPEIGGRRFQIAINVLESIKNNSQKLLATGEVERFVCDEMQLYREIFSDLIPYCLLEVKPDDYKEVFSVSEGSKYGETISNQLQQRLYVLEALNHTFADNNDLNQYRGDIAEFETWKKIHDLRVDYAETCKKTIERWIQDNDKKKQVDDLREMYLLLNGKEVNDDPENGSSIKKIYSLILKKTESFKNSMKQQLDQDLKKILD